MVISSQHDCYKIPTIFLGHKVISILLQEGHEILRFLFFFTTSIVTFYSSSFTAMFCVRKPQDVSTVRREIVIWHPKMFSPKSSWSASATRISQKTLFTPEHNAATKDTEEGTKFSRSKLISECHTILSATFL